MQLLVRKLFLRNRLSYPRLIKGEVCVEPTEVMRKYHMDFLLHQRDKTVHQGIRTKNHSLVNCIDCHVQKNTQGGIYSD